MGRFLVLRGGGPEVGRRMGGNENSMVLKFGYIQERYIHCRRHRSRCLWQGRFAATHARVLSLASVVNSPLIGHSRNGQSIEP